jgi:uncharacterized protein YjbJ (UPF0337 family)
LQQYGAKETKMKWNRIEGGWQQFKGNFKRRWRKLTNVDVITGNREQLALNIQERYGITPDKAEKQLADWQARQKEIDRHALMPSQLRSGYGSAQTKAPHPVNLLPHQSEKTS